MKHLTVDEIIDFVSADRFDSESMKLVDRVNLHIRNCDECLTEVKAFQLVYDELTDIGKKGDFRALVYEIMTDEPVSDKKNVENFINRQCEKD